MLLKQYSKFACIYGEIKVIFVWVLLFFLFFNFFVFKLQLMKKKKYGISIWQDFQYVEMLLVVNFQDNVVEHLGDQQNEEQWGRLWLNVLKCKSRYGQQYYVE
eukprot:TRINITY_DN84_c0_g1_i11.p3 TRINITY_DN84_c0_g1~~TRINITY_DN84_c0_g1_i11.p3  ORF type:complete len:103 (-),score=6.52 TRINITY_DN84_c0_g1_i11:76-384(-)